MAGLRPRLLAREPLVGTVLTQPGMALAELTAEAADFVWIDLEHGALGVADVLPLAVAARAGGASAAVRLAGADAGGANAVLDAGVEAVVVPRVESAADAAAIAALLRHPPRGSRGVASRRANRYGRGPDGEVACLAQIESPRGIDNAPEIAAVDGVDALVVGCADLACSLGEGGSLGSTLLLQAIEHVQAAARAGGIASGIAGPDDPALLAELGQGGSTLFVLSADVRIYARALDEGMAALRRELVPRPEESRVGA